jgi:hypothetical protein
MLRFALIIWNMNLLLSSCQENCNVDPEFKREFFNCISLIEKIHTEGYSSSVKVRGFTYECLYAVTGYEGHADKGNEPPYFALYSDSIDYIKVDIEKWSQWYESNKCSMTLQKADSLFNQWSVNHGDSLQWPPPVKIAVKFEN